MAVNQTSPAPNQLDPGNFRRVLGKIPTSVAVITAVVNGEQVGMTVGSLTSVSLDPPLIAFFVMQSSTTLPAIEQAGTFCVNVLGQDQGDVCYAFASKKGPRFGAGNWDSDNTRPPRLNEAVAWIDCEIESIFEAGDHLGVMGRVVDLASSPANHEPMIFHRGALSRVRPTKRDLATQRLTWWWDHL